MFDENNRFTIIIWSVLIVRFDIKSQNVIRQCLENTFLFHFDFFLRLKRYILYTFEENFKTDDIHTSKHDSKLSTCNGTK